MSIGCSPLHFRYDVIKTTRWLVILALCCVCGQSMTAADELSTLRDKLAEWHRGMVNLQVRCRVVAVKGDEPVTPPITRLEEWVWTDAGELKTATVNFTDGVVSARSLYLWDRERYCTTRYPYGPSVPEQPLGVSIAPLASCRHQLMFMPLYGLWFQQERHWLDQQLELTKAELAPPEVVDGRSCPVLVIPINPQHPYRITLDPDHDYLPRRSRTSLFHYTVTEFRQLANGSWFPWKGRFDFDTPEIELDELWEMESVERNTVLPARTFELPIGIGTEVFDWVKNKQYVHGLSEREQLERLRASQRNTPPVQRAEVDQQLSGKTVSARPPDTLPWMSVILSSMSVLSLVACLFFRWRTIG